MFDFSIHPHKRLNILTGEWILVSPHRTKRPWQGKVEDIAVANRPSYDPTCYLCPGNKRAEGTQTPVYTDPLVFVNDFSALMPDTPAGSLDNEHILVAKSESGICKVICFSPRHDLTLPQMSVEEINKVVAVWISEFKSLSANPSIQYIQIFENKGEIMGCSNPHPHGQIWASSSLPIEIAKETVTQEAHFKKHGKSLLSSYLEIELQKQERVVVENDHFVALVPFWAVWPYETLLISKRHVRTIVEFNQAEQESLADILKQLTTRYDNVFNVSFPYSAGMHQAPVNNGEQNAWHWHMHFYPPLLRSATVKKFMVGYEMLANPQRDITAEAAAETLRNISGLHYTMVNPST